MSGQFTVFSDLVCELGEGPSYDPRRQSLYWFDILGKRLLEKRFGQSGTHVHDLPFMASAIAGLGGSRHLIAAEDGLYVRDTATGALSLHRSLEAGNPLTRSNDARVHPSGAMWIGTMGRHAEQGAGAIYWHFKGEIRTLWSGLTIPNSIAFSPDGRIGYHADTGRNIVWRVSLDPLTGLPDGEPKIFLDHGGKPGGIDGSVVDADGLIWNARWGAGALDVYAPDGSHLKRHDGPARQMTCPAFLGPDASRLAVTSAWEHMDPTARAADPLAGQTFLLDIPVKGRFEPDAVLE